MESLQSLTPGVAMMAGPLFVAGYTHPLMVSPSIVLNSISSRPAITTELNE